MIENIDVQLAVTHVLTLWVEYQQGKQIGVHHARVTGCLEQILDDLDSIN